MEQTTKLIVNKDRLLHNLTEIKKQTKGTKVCAIVKADAYGIGAYDVVSVLNKKVDFFAVSNISEALEVRAEDSDTPVLVLVPIFKEYYSLCANNNISVCVQNIEDINYLSEQDFTINVHIKINSGLNRFGTNSIKEFMLMQEKIMQSHNIIFEGIFTHFGSADFVDKKYLIRQFTCFKKFIKKINKNFFNPIIHCGNSACALLGGKLHQNMVRIGKSLYGYNPVESQVKVDLLPVIEIHSKIVNIVNANAGEFVGYSNNYFIRKKTKIAVVQCGFADGYKRALSNKGRVIINNSYCNIVGNICMDSFMVDISSVKNAIIGDDVIILGKSADKEITAKELADICGTTIYEILTSFSKKRIQTILE